MADCFIGELSRGPCTTCMSLDILCEFMKSQNGVEWRREMRESLKTELKAQFEEEMAELRRQVDWLKTEWIKYASNSCEKELILQRHMDEAQKHVKDSEAALNILKQEIDAQVKRNASDFQAMEVLLVGERTNRISENTKMHDSLKKELSELKCSLQKQSNDRTNELRKEINVIRQDEAQKMTEFNSKLDSMNKILAGHRLVEYKEKNSIGVIGQLRSEETSKFDPQVIVNLSSCDSYDLIQDNTRWFGTSNEVTEIVFEFKESVTVDGIFIRKVPAYYGPREFSFWTAELDQDGKYSPVTEICKFTGEDTSVLKTGAGEKSWKFNRCSGTCFMIKTGRNWNVSKDEYYFDVQYLDLLSPNDNYRMENGRIFATLFKQKREIRNHVYISHRCDTSSIHILPAPYNIFTDDGADEHISVAIQTGMLFATSYRIETSENFVNSWVLEGSKDNETWVELDRRNATVTGYRETFCFSILESKQRAFKYFRLGSKGAKEKDGRQRLRLYHFDLFGVLVRDLF